MRLDPVDLRHQVIRPTLTYLGMCSPVAEELLLTTAAVESNLNPLCNGESGIGIYQIREEQHQQVWDEYLAFNPDLASRVRGLASQHRFLQDPHQELGSNLSYATAIAWLMYQRQGVEVIADAATDILVDLWRECFHAGQKTDKLSRRFCGCLSRYRQAA